MGALTLYVRYAASPVKDVREIRLCRKDQTYDGLVSAIASVFDRSVGDISRVLRVKHRTVLCRDKNVKKLETGESVVVYWKPQH